MELHKLSSASRDALKSSSRVQSTRELHEASFKGTS